MKINTAFIGFGKSANRYHLPFIDQSIYNIMGYYKPSDREFEMPYPHVHDLTRFASIEELLQSNVELVIVTSPAKYHFEHAKLALEAKKHVVLEKPACASSAEYVELVRLAKANGVELQVYQNRRFDSDFMALRKVLASERLGKIMEIESNHTQLRDDNLDIRGEKLDGYVFGHAVHFIDQIVSLFGRPDRVSGDIGNQRNLFLGDGKKYGEEDVIEDYYDIKLFYGNTRVRVRYSPYIFINPPRFIVNGTKAGYSSYGIDRQEEFLKHGFLPGEENYFPKLDPGVLVDAEGFNEVNIPITTYSVYYNRLYKFLRENGRPVIDHMQVVTTLDIMNAVIKNK